MRRLTIKIGTLADAKNPVHWTPSYWINDRAKGIMLGRHPTQDGAGICLEHDTLGNVYAYKFDQSSVDYFRGVSDGKRYGTERTPDWFRPARKPSEDPMYWVND
jgi:hypothetical protein